MNPQEAFASDDFESSASAIPPRRQERAAATAPFYQKSFSVALFAASCLWICAIVGPRLGAPFVWDDLPTLAYNDRLGSAAFADLFAPRYFEVAQEFSYRPASTLLHWAGLRLFGTKPAGHRALELALHILAALLLVSAFARWGIAVETAWACGALFLLHPLHLETLFCVSFNEEILVAALLLLSWLARMRWQEGGAPWLWLSALAFGAALFAKETAVMGLPALWLLERHSPARPAPRELGGGDRRAPSFHLWEEGWGGEYLSWWPYLAALALFVVVRFWLLRGPQGSAGFPVSPPLPMRLYFAGLALAQTVRLAAAPLGLRIEYFAVPPAGAGELAAALAGWALALGAAALAWARRRDPPGVLQGLAWGGLMLLPALNLVPAYALTTRYFAERWTYVPLVGLLLAAASLAQRKPALRAGVVPLALWLGLCGAAGARPWSDERLLWARLISAYPWSAKAHEGLGEARYRAGEYRAALESFETGLRLRVERRDRLLEYYLPLFEARAAGRPLPLSRETPSVHRWLARAWLALGRPDQARAHLRWAEALSSPSLLP